MDNIVIADKASSQLTAQNWGNVNLSQPSVVQIPVKPDQVASTSRSGQDLMLNLRSGEQIKITNFFVTSPDGVANDIVFQGDDATLWQARYSAEPFNGFMGWSIFAPNLTIQIRLSTLQNFPNHFTNLLPIRP